MSAATDRFRDLALQVQPIDAELAPLKLEMVRLSSEISLEIVTAAFPEAKVLRLRAISEIKPSDGGKNAMQAVEMIQSHKLKPSVILHDEARSIVIVLLDPLPPAAKPAAKKKVSRKTK